MTGNLLGAIGSGLIGDFLGWRGVLAVLGVLVIWPRLRLPQAFSGAALARPPRTSLAALRQGYRTIFTNPNARFCYAAVFIEGCCVLGLFPFVASFLFDLGETSLSIAGIVIAGFAVGGLFYTMTVSRFLPRLGVRGMMIAGGRWSACSSPCVAFGPGWKIQALSLLFMGWGFYMIHGCLQVFASELPWKRAPPRCRCTRSSFSWARPLVRSPTDSASTCRQVSDLLLRRDHGRAGICLRAAAAADAADGQGTGRLRMTQCLAGQSRNRSAVPHGTDIAWLRSKERPWTPKSFIRPTPTPRPEIPDTPRSLRCSNS